MANLPDLKDHAFAAVMKQGGKKKLDALLDTFKQSAPEWVALLAEAKNLPEALKPAKALQNSASTLGLEALADLCFGILEAKTWAEAKALVPEIQTRLPRALSAIVKERSFL